MLLPLFVVALCTLGIIQFRKLGKFLVVADNPNLPKHSKKIMLFSLLKYLACLIALTLCTYQILIYPMIFVWGCSLYFIYHYIKLWKYHKYSVAVLICISGAIIMISILISPFVRPIIARIILMA